MYSKLRSDRQRPPLSEQRPLDIAGYRIDTLIRSDDHFSFPGKAQAHDAVAGDKLFRRVSVRGYTHDTVMARVAGGHIEIACLVKRQTLWAPETAKKFLV